ncbi:hypothetical protein EVAR_8068_1 [Eumeta japonica]|uniref:Uncharacterized protein n=1 Tax=Eumeta variegata TaxID=151549 RepID=A0A4C1TSK0_EUMVA|nr:hypothetical protein EVAR_8068_1 [Eumeta japonica]
MVFKKIDAETVRGLGVQTAGSPECVAGTDARGLTAAARLTLRGTPYQMYFVPHTLIHARSPTLRNAARRNTDTQ